ncbi:two-component system response regulator BtsR [Psychromonas sp. Urea-02u-13]|uniref:two-component system response regulator BtsR n=1 Tax=Psychromonas sp. Urea-02u-13 TaxID=2058326 RepID=UPI000C3415C4|nr:two-component system response regulator BtsR [Psychromonas sp. Urea-02u-13]PKG39950.1 two-component system response regulator YehT [Psychromonas sp. Urea-02u-13]
MLKVLVIDDEQYAREELIALLDEQDEVDVEIVGACNNAIEGLKKVHQLKPDLIFLDIQMPQISGMEMLAMLDVETMPKVVFVTAFDEYALQAFEDNAFDYILKPVEPCRLLKTLQRVQSSVQPTDYKALTNKPLSLIPCAGFNRYVLLKPSEIEIAYSDQSGVHIIGNQADSTENSCSLSLKVLEEKTELLRCHRQYLINPNAIREIRLLDNSLAEIITTSGAVAPVSRRYLKMLKDRFQLS